MIIIPCPHADDVIGGDDHGMSLAGHPARRAVPVQKYLVADQERLRSQRDAKIVKGVAVFRLKRHRHRPAGDALREGEIKGRHQPTIRAA